MTRLLFEFLYSLVLERIMLGKKLKGSTLTDSELLNLFEGQSYREWDTDKDLPSAGLFPKRLQWLRMDQAKPRSQGLHPAFCAGARTIFHCLHRHNSREQDWKRGAGRLGFLMAPTEGSSIVAGNFMHCTRMWTPAGISPSVICPLILEPFSALHR